MTLFFGRLFVGTSLALVASLVFADSGTVGGDVRSLSIGPAELMEFPGIGKYLQLQDPLARHMFDEMTEIPLEKAPEGSTAWIKVGKNMTCGYEERASGKEYFCWFNMVDITHGGVYTYNPFTVRQSAK